MKTEAQKLQDWLDNEKKNGLTDFKIDLHHDADKSKMTLESLAKEINEMIAAPAIPDPDFF